MKTRWLALWLCMTLSACSGPKPDLPEQVSESETAAQELSKPPSTAQAPTKVAKTPASETADNNETQPPLDGYDNEQLMSACLSPEQLKAGWIRLFDGQSLWGWFYVGAANWQVRNGNLYVDSGEPSFLCTSFQIADYELLVDFNCPAETNSGIFLRTIAAPQDVQRDCYELNIAPPDNPFPTGSLVKRQKVDAEVVGEVAPDTWHTYRILAEGDLVKIWLDDKLVLEFTDPQPLRRGYISLQHNSGSVRFRNVLMRPLGSKEITLGEDWQSAWTKTEKVKENAQLSVTASEEGLRLKGGPGQIETKEQWQDFVLQASYQLANPQVDSGILFRCVPSTLDAGYEFQINHATEGGQIAKPAQGGTGSISFGAAATQQPARLVVGDGTMSTYVTLIADQGQFATWVNGVQIADCSDARPASDDPNAGLRREPGPIALQGRDASTEVLFRHLSIAPIESRN